jgi:hypothetical protein
MDTAVIGVMVSCVGMLEVAARQIRLWRRDRADHDSSGTFSIGTVIQGRS